MSYDFVSPPSLETRIHNLIAWWRLQSDDAGDEGSIWIMADQLERALRGPNSATITSSSIPVRLT